MTYCKNNKNADKIVSYIVERCNSLNSVYDYLDALDTKSLSEEDFSAIFDGFHVVVSRDKEKAYMLYALFGHHKTRPHYILDVEADNKEVRCKGIKNSVFDLICHSSGKLCLRHWNDDIIFNDDEISHDIHEKMRFTNSLLQLSHELFKHEYLPFSIVNPKIQYLNVFNRVENCQNEEWIKVEAPDKLFMLFYMQEDTSLVSDSNNHYPVYCANAISIALPLVQGIATKPCQYYTGSYFCSSFCYMEAR